MQWVQYTSSSLLAHQVMYLEMKYYLTIDDGPSSDAAAKLPFLDEHGIMAIWFCLGTHLAVNREAAQAIVRAGHILANHSYTHPHFSDISIEEAEREISDTQDLIDGIYAEAGTALPPRYFRFPYGEQGQWVGATPSDAPEKRAHQRQLREFLTAEGYRNPLINHIEYTEPYANHPDDGDWLWSYDVREWAIGYKESPATYDETLHNLRAYLAQPTGVHDRVILMHDHLHTARYFAPLIREFVHHGVPFELPDL